MNAQLSMFDTAIPRLLGIPEPGTFDSAVDGPRTARQLDAVEELMSDGMWRTLAAIAAHTGASEAGASARLRDLRKRQYGGYVVERKRAKPGSGLYLYRVVKP